MKTRSRTNPPAATPAISGMGTGEPESDEIMLVPSGTESVPVVMEPFGPDVIA